MRIDRALCKETNPYNQPPFRLIAMIHKIRRNVTSRAFSSFPTLFFLSAQRRGHQFGRTWPDDGLFEAKVVVDGKVGQALLDIAFVQ